MFPQTDGETAGIAPPTAPRPGDSKGWPDEAIRAIEAPMLLLAGDSDIVQPVHVVAMFRLLGGGVVGDLVGLPRSQLAILPGTTHVTLVHRAELIVPMVESFLAAPAG